MLFHDEHDAAFGPKPLAIIRLAHSLSFLIIMILFNVYLTKVYHVRIILMFVNFWTEATNLPTFVEIREILLTLPPMQSMRDLDNLISDMRTVETLGDGNSASE